MLITVFRQRMTQEIKKSGLTPQKFATQKLEMSYRRFSGVIKRKTLRLRRVDEISNKLGLVGAELLTLEEVIPVSLDRSTLPACVESAKENIPQLLEIEGLSAARVAKVLGITKQALSQDMTTGNFGLERLEKISEVLEVAPWKLVLPKTGIQNNV